LWLTFPFSKFFRFDLNGGLFWGHQTAIPRCEAERWFPGWVFPNRFKTRRFSLLVIRLSPHYCILRGAYYFFNRIFIGYATNAKSSFKLLQQSGQTPCLKASAALDCHRWEMLWTKWELPTNAFVAVFTSP
jgi:hypothetical protein